MANRFRVEYRLYQELPTAYTVAPDNEVGININNLVLSFRHSGYQHYETSATTTFTIAGNFYAFVKYHLWESLLSVSNAVELRIFDTQCRKYLRGNYYIKPNGVTWCREDCTADVQAKHEDLDLACLMDTLIDTDQATNPNAAHNWFSGGLTHPTFPYCKNNRLIYIIALLLFCVPVVGFILLVLFAFGVGNEMYRRARGCDRKLPSPLITTYITNLIDNCSVVLDSDTVFTTPSKMVQLAKACIFYAPVEKGLALSDNTTRYKLTNALNWSGKMFFEFLKKRFNIKWRLNPSGLLIRHFDESYSEPIFDFRNVVDVCCEWTGEKPPAYGDYQFALDTLDSEGNASRRAYNDIVEFNSPFSPAQSGSIVRKFEDAAVGFRNDGMRSDDISQTEKWFTSATYLLAAIGTLPNANAFVMTSDYTTSVPKVIIWDGVSNMNQAKAIRKNWSGAEIAVMVSNGYDPAQFGSQYDETTYFYNFIAPVNEELHNVTPNCWQLFECDNPRLCECRKEWICKVKISNCSCSVLALTGIYEDSTTGAIIDYPVILDSQHIGEIVAMDIDFSSNEILFTVKPVSCYNDTEVVPLPCSVVILSIIVGGLCNEDGTVEITVNYGGANIGELISVSIGDYQTTVLTDDGTATLTVLGTGETVPITLQSLTNNDCNVSTLYELPVCCSANDADLEITCNDDCDQYQVYRVRIEDNGGSFEVHGITVNGVTHNNSGGAVSTGDYCDGIPDMLDEWATAFPGLTFGGKLTDDYFEVLVIAPCCDTTEYEIEVAYFVDDPLTATVPFLDTMTCEEITDYLTDEDYATVPCSMGAYQTGFECCAEFCFTATATGSPIAVDTDVIEYSFNGIDWVVGSTACIDEGETLYFRRTITFLGECEPVVIERTVTNVTDCTCYSILDTDTDEIVGGAGNCGGANFPCDCIILDYSLSITPPSGLGTNDGIVEITVTDPHTCFAPFTVRGVTLMPDLCSVYDAVNPATCPESVTVVGLQITGLPVNDATAGTTYNIALADANGCIWGFTVTLYL